MCTSVCKNNMCTNCILHHFPLMFVLTFSSSVTLMMYPDDFVSRCDAIAKDSLSTSSVMNPIWQKSIAKKSLSTDYNQIASVLARSLPVWWWFSGLNIETFPQKQIWKISARSKCVPNQIRSVRPLALMKSWRAKRYWPLTSLWFWLQWPIYMQATI